MQVYVGAFEHLWYNQTKYDRLKNEGTSKAAIQLSELLLVSKNLLCEVAVAISATSNKMPRTLSRQQMERKLKFRTNSNNSPPNEVDELDCKFTVVRFNEYVHNMRSVMRNRLAIKRTLRQRKQKTKELKSKRKAKAKKGLGKKQNGGEPAAMNEVSKIETVSKSTAVEQVKNGMNNKTDKSSQTREKTNKNTSEEWKAKHYRNKKQHEQNRIRLSKPKTNRSSTTTSIPELLVSLT